MYVSYVSCDIFLRVYSTPLKNNIDVFNALVLAPLISFDEK